MVSQAAVSTTENSVVGCLMVIIHTSSSKRNVSSPG